MYVNSTNSPGFVVMAAADGENDQKPMLYKSTLASGMPVVGVFYYSALCSRQMDQSLFGRNSPSSATMGHVMCLSG